MSAAPDGECDSCDGAGVEPDSSACTPPHGSDCGCSAAFRRPIEEGQHTIDLHRIQARYQLARLAGTDAEDASQGWDAVKLRVLVASWQDVAVLHDEVVRLRWARVYHHSGRCRFCSGFEGSHQMRCKYYVGPLEHRMNLRGANGSFGGWDYDCVCGGWFRQGGIAGHGDGASDAEVVCPNVDQTWRGPVEKEPEP